MFCSTKTRIKGEGDDQLKGYQEIKKGAMKNIGMEPTRLWRILRLHDLENSLVRLDGQGGRLGRADVCILRSLLYKVTTKYYFASKHKERMRQEAWSSMKGLGLCYRYENADRKIEDLYRQLYEIGYSQTGKEGEYTLTAGIDDNWSALGLEPGTPDGCLQPCVSSLQSGVSQLGGKRGTSLRVTFTYVNFRSNLGNQKNNTEKIILVLIITAIISL